MHQVGATLGVAVMGAFVTAGTGWSMLISAAVCVIALGVFAVSGAQPRFRRVW